MEQVIFYILAAATVIATLLAITERHAVHAIVYLVTSFFALAVIFYLLGAPVVAVFEVIIYAGAIMVLFLFVIMMLDLGHPEKAARPGMGDWWPALALAGIILTAVATLVAGQGPPATAGSSVSVKDFSLVLFKRYGVAVEIISMQLLFALVGALYLAKKRDVPSPDLRPPSPPERGDGGEGERGDRAP